MPVPPLRGGAVEKRWFALGKELARQGHIVVHVSRSYDNLPAEEWADGVHYKRTSGFATPKSGVYLKWLDLRYTLKAKSEIPQDTDVVVTNTFWAPLVLPDYLQNRCMVDVARMPKGQMRWYHRAARLRANSTPVAQAIYREIPAPQHHRVVTIPNPIPFAQLPQVNFATKKPVALYVGRVHPEKGLDILLNATRALGNEWTFKIIGPAEVAAGGGGNAYLTALQRINKSANVEFVGPVYDPVQLDRYYAEASVLVYPSVAEQGETFGLAPLEAMAWGCVPIVSRLACFSDFIEHEKNGLVFDHRHEQAANLLAQAIRQLQRDAVLRTKLAQRATEVHRSHSVAAIASLFVKEFEQMNKKR